MKDINYSIIKVDSMNWQVQREHTIEKDGKKKRVTSKDGGYFVCIDIAALHLYELAIKDQVENVLDFKEFLRVAGVARKATVDAVKRAIKEIK